MVAAGVEGLVTDAAMTDVDPSALDPAYGGSPLLTVAPGDAGAAASAFEAALRDNGLELGGYLDLTLEQVLLQGAGDLSDRWTHGMPVTQLGAPATVTLDLADDRQGHDGYWVLHGHGGDVDVLSAEYLGGALTFETDQFSTYAVAYKVEDEPGPGPELTGTRVAGENRYDTTYKLVKETHKAGQPIFVATGSVFADALSAGPAAAAADGSIVLAPKSGMTSAMLDLLQQQKPSHIYVIGGKSAVSVKAETQLKGVAPVTRVGGKDRYETSLKVFQQFFAGHTFESGFVATGVTFPDALSAAVPAGKITQRLVLSNGDCIAAPVVSQWINGPGSQISQVTLVGGTAVLKPSVEQLIECAG